MLEGHLRRYKILSVRLRDVGGWRVTAKITNMVLAIAPGISVEAL